MDEVTQFCELGVQPISLPCDWNELEEAKKLLLSKGYIQVHVEEEDKEAGVVSFELPTHAPIAKFVFPQDSPKPQYLTRRSVAVAEQSGPWKRLRAVQIDTTKFKEKLKIVFGNIIPHILQDSNREQEIAINFLAQPYVQVEENQFCVKMDVETLMVGVLPKHFLRDRCLGYYPHFISLKLEPVVQDKPLLSVVSYLARKDDSAIPVPEEPPLKKTITTNAGLKIGFRPAVIQVGRSIAKEVLEGRKDCLIPIREVDAANIATFEWRLVRWDDGTKYKTDSPEVSFRFNKTRKLPFYRSASGSCPCIEEFPSVVWKFSPDIEKEHMKIRITVHAKFHLVWFLGRFIRSLGSDVQEMEFENYWELKI